MKKDYVLSALVLTVLAVIISLIATINEDISVKILATAIFSVATFIFGILCSFITRFIIRIGDAIEKIGLKLLYYLSLSVVSLAIFYIILLLGKYQIDRRHVSTGQLSTELSFAVVYVFAMCIVFIGIFVPTIQSYIVLLIRLFTKHDGEKENNI